MSARLRTPVGAVLEQRRISSSTSAPDSRSASSVVPFPPANTPSLPSPGGRRPHPAKGARGGGAPLPPFGRFGCCQATRVPNHPGSARVPATRVCRACRGVQFRSSPGCLGPPAGLRSCRSLSLFATSAAEGWDSTRRIRFVNAWQRCPPGASEPPSRGRHAGGHGRRGAVPEFKLDLARADETAVAWTARILAA